MNTKSIQLLSISAAMAGAAPVMAQPFAINWSSVDGGGTTTAITGGPYAVVGTIGQPDAGSSAAGAFGCVSGFWAAAAGGTACYANCDGSTATPVLNVNDFICFQTRYAQGDPYANCDGSTTLPVLNVNDFICFQSRFAQGCP